MTIVNTDYEFEIQENVVYQVRKIDFTNVAPSMHITGTGTVDLLGSLQTPASVSDPILTLEPQDSGLGGFYQFNQAIPNFIKLEPNAVGTRVITLSGFFEPEEVIF